MEGLMFNRYRVSILDDGKLPEIDSNDGYKVV